MADLEKIIGKDIKQAEKFAEGLEQSIGRMQTELKELENRQREIHAKLIDTADRAREAWDYVAHLKEKV